MSRPTLYRGEQSDLVATVKQQLKYELYRKLHADGFTDRAIVLMKLPDTNLYDAGMEFAVLGVQAAYGLPTTGKIDEATWELLDTKGAPF